MAAGDRVNVIRGQTPKDYHCQCEYCVNVIGELRPTDQGSYYSRLERRQYYDKIEQGGEGHVAKTPLHIARWAVQEYTRPGDWVLDPTIGAGTTAVEAITQGRNVAGMELQFDKIIQANVQKNIQGRDVLAKIRIGDARNIGAFLDELRKEGARFRLVVNNPPYSGDEHMSTLNVPEDSKHQSKTFTYKDDLPNLAFLKEGPAYWEAMREIYSQSCSHLETKGHLVTGIKDMMRSKKPFTLHRDFCEMIGTIPKMKFVGTAFLKHWPTTMFLNTYHKMYAVHPPYYQTISVFRKDK